MESQDSYKLYLINGKLLNFYEMFTFRGFSGIPALFLSGFFFFFFFTVTFHEVLWSTQTNSFLSVSYPFSYLW